MPAIDSLFWISKSELKQTGIAALSGPVPCVKQRATWYLVPAEISKAPIPNKKPPGPRCPKNSDVWNLLLNAPHAQLANESSTKNKVDRTPCLKTNAHRWDSDPPLLSALGDSRRGKWASSRGRCSSGPWQRKQVRPRPMTFAMTRSRCTVLTENDPPELPSHPSKARGRWSRSC